MTRIDVTSRKLIAWKTFRLDHRIASVRYRCLLPIQGLRRQGWESVVFEEGETLLCSGLAALIFVKSFTSSDLKLARRMKAEGVPVILDLCDNIFVPNYASAAVVDPVGSFREMTQMASAIVVSTEPLARKVRDLSPQALRIEIIPDSLESPSDARTLESPESYLVLHRYAVAPQVLALLLPHTLLRAALPRLRSVMRRIDRSGNIRRIYRSLNLAPRLVLMLSRRLRHLGKAAASQSLSRSSHPQKIVARLPVSRPNRLAIPKDARLNSHPLRRQVVWFGHHGGSHGPFGMGMIAEVLPALNEVDRTIPLELVVVSNNEDKFQELTRGTSFPAKYYPWRLQTVFSLIEEADVCILPNAKDEFSICKSPNRAVLALSLGVPVVASSLPSLEPFRQCVIFDDWAFGLTTYLTDPAKRCADLAHAAEVISRYFSGSAVADKWNCLLADLVESNTRIAVESYP